MFEELIRGWDGEHVVVRFDEPTGAWMLVGIHSTVLGPAVGGTRMKVYRSLDEGLADVLRLSQAMTMKQAAAGLDLGGGKAVLAVPAVPSPGSGLRRELMLRYGDLVASLGGTYITAADMNTGEADLDIVGERTDHVLGRSIGCGGSGSSADATATGVFHGIQAGARHALGSADLSGVHLLVQGVGAVGGRLAEMLRDAGARLSLADLDDARASKVASNLGVEPMPAHRALDAPCDIFAPCATGGVLSAESIPLLRCRVVAGAANNQLATPWDADRLDARGILYAPDYVINAGGVIHLVGYERLGWGAAQVAARLSSIGQTLSELFDEAEREGLTTAAAADRLARDRIAAAR
ncbi:MAG TPA: Glu/Leu/Phe/Val dehydrogenase dimerization domain-containing protein [Actinomycetota bacterium]|nr:Glu/Leu/Phe/Val dehydrogenase dimerization domain-containing protein [Actinomycetota bacterium]